MSTDAHPSGMSKFNPPPKSKVAEDDMSYKDQLDQAAHDAREPESNTTQESVVNPVIEKGEWSGRLSVTPFRFWKSRPFIAGGRSPIDRPPSEERAT